MRFHRFVYLVFLVSIFGKVAAQENDTLLNTVSDELKREWDILQNEKLPPYYISYRVVETKQVNCVGSLGALISSDTINHRVVQTNVRVGNYDKDNTRMSQEMGEPIGEGVQFMPLENIPEAIRMAMWQSTDQAYSDAVESYQALILNKKFEEQDTVPDFAKAKPAVYYEPAIDFKSFDFSAWNEKVKLYSTHLNRNVNLLEGTVQLSFSLDRKYFYSSEGTSVVQNTVKSYMSVNATINGVDNVPVSLSFQHYSPMPGQLPDDASVLNEIDKMLAQLVQLRNAPYAEPFEGPAILSAKASGVFFHEIFGHRIEGQRMRSESDGQTFKNQVGELVLPKDFTVISDPTITDFKNLQLSGDYKYDDQGVPSQKVTVVENGVLKEFLMSRTPIDKDSQSNGHGRCEFGNSPVARQSNLIIQSNNQNSMDELRKQLVKECKRQHKKYGYYFAEVTGGFTNTSRYNPNAFEVIPLEVYRVFVDGRPDELVRGVNLIGTPLAMFAEIKASGDTYEVFNGFCGAESGSIPVSAVAPALFVKQIETQREGSTKLKPTILSRPEIKK